MNHPHHPNFPSNEAPSGLFDAPKDPPEAVLLAVRPTAAVLAPVPSAKPSRRSHSSRTSRVWFFFETKAEMMILIFLPPKIPGFVFFQKSCRHLNKKYKEMGKKKGSVTPDHLGALYPINIHYTRCIWQLIFWVPHPKGFSHHFLKSRYHLSARFLKVQLCSCESTAQRQPLWWMSRITCLAQKQNTVVQTGPRSRLNKWGLL